MKLTELVDLAYLLDRCDVDPETGCWHWKRAPIKGSQLLTVKRKGKTYSMRARRAAIVLSGRHMPGSHVAWQSSRCDEPDCIAPDHSAIGTRAQMVRSMKQRGAYQTKALVESSRKSMAKLKGSVIGEAKARQILMCTLPHREAAAALDVSYDVVRHVRNRRTWKHVSTAPASIFELAPL